MKLHCLLTATALLAACGGRTSLLDLGKQNPTGGAVGSDDGSDPSQTGVRPGSYDAGDPNCLGTCSMPPGPLQVHFSEAEIGAALIGVWQICYGGAAIFTGAPSDTIGVEFAPPHTQDESGDPIGTMYLLTKGTSGPVRGNGVAYQQTYEITGGVVLCASYQREHVYDLGLKYSPCPREWWFQNWEWNQSGVVASF
jgi:hypothetical protein